MAHRLLHSLVFSSVMVLEGLGCTASHTPEGEARPPPEPTRPIDPPIAPPDRVVDAGAPADAEPSDAGLEVEDAGGPPDADVFDAADPRFCEPGWPTTKASFCAVVDMDTEFERIECCNSFVPDGASACCIGRPEDVR